MSTFTADTLFDLNRTASAISSEINCQESQVIAAVRLLDDGNTIPFVARYRKEATRGLDERQLQAISDGIEAARELAARKATILNTIDEQQKLTSALQKQIIDCDSRQELEDLYLPYRPRRRTRATIAREKGLEPLAEMLMAQTPLQESRSQLLKRFVNAERDVPSAEAALEGACDIVAEVWSESPQARTIVQNSADRGQLVSKVRRGKSEGGEAFEAYFQHAERVDRVPSHRFLAMQRGEAEGILKLDVAIDEDRTVGQLSRLLLQNPSFDFARELQATLADSLKRLMRPAAVSAVMRQLKEKADTSAIGVFAQNIRKLLLAAPAGPRTTLGIDPGFRTGCKVAVVDETGAFRDYTTIFPTPPRSDTQQAGEALLKLIKKYKVQLIAIGNGTASRETTAFVQNLIQQHDLQITAVSVSESGASIYSASDAAIEEFPDLDLTIRGAISIARRLQDPLAELVKIDPKTIGVGQYQHDVNQAGLQKSLDREVESCVNSVGIDVNTASSHLLSRVAGIGPALAKRIVEHRNQHGAFSSRSELQAVSGLGRKAFEQCAGFLRIRNGKNPLDNSAVHPESYGLVERIASECRVTSKELVGNSDLVNRLSVEALIDDSAGEFTVRDILAELAQPGRDPRSEFRAAQFDDNINCLEDVRQGMKLEGVVTNVTQFGAFVDVGVHQDGLIHISQLANHFVRDPAEVISVGDIVQVTVLDVDLQRKRISLSRIAK
jgi:uncharacterized protein